MARRTDKRIEDLKPPKDPAALITWAEKKYESASKIDEFQGKQNLAFMLGQQWGVWDQTHRRFQNQSPNVRRGDPNAAVRITINKIGGLVERIIARLVKHVPVAECRPVTDTQADVNAAKVGTRILDHELNARLKLQQRLVELYFWVVPLGWSFFHVRWDPNAGPVVGQGSQGQDLHRGEIALDEVPGFEIRLDPNARRFRDAQYLIRTVAMTPEAVYEQYGILPEGGDAADTMADEWRLSASPEDRTRDGSTTGRPSKEQYIAVKQLWYRPGGRIAPEGLVVTWSGKTILEGPTPFPYEHGRLPFVPFNLLPAVGGDPAGRTWLTDLIGPQRDYNDARSREATIRRTLTPKILAAAGSIDPNRLTSRVEVITYNPVGTAPSLQMPDGRWMSQFVSAMERVDVEMNERAGQTDVSQGRAATSAPAASILALQEADETKLAISSTELAASIEDLGHQMLMLVKQFWDEERTIRTWSRDGVLEVQQFTGADLGEQLDVHVSSESGLPKSKTARTQLAIDLLAQGIISDPRDFVRMLDLPGTDFLVETLNVDAAQANREHGYLLQMDPVEAKTWHDHAVHITEHNKFRKSEEYEHLSPDQQAWFDGHVDAHYAQVLGQMSVPTPDGQFMPELSQAAASMMPGGTTNPTGENGQPVDPMTGRPSDPNAIGGLSGNLGADQMGPLGGTGNAGPVPGVTPDTQLYRQGD